MAAPIAIGAVDALVSNTCGRKAVPVRPDGYRGGRRAGLKHLWSQGRAPINRGSGYSVKH